MQEENLNKKSIRKTTRRVRSLLKFFLGLDKYGLLKYKNHNLSIGKRVYINSIKDTFFGKDVYISTMMLIQAS